MNTAAIKKIIIPIGIVVGVLLAGVLGAYLIKNLHFSVTGTNPSTKNVSTAAPFFKVNFNRTLSKNGLILSADPDSLIKSYSVDGKVLTINLGYPLQPKRPHTIVIGSIQDSSGEKITNKHFTFIPRYIADLPADQTRALLQQQDPNNKRTTDPILTHLPYITLDFELRADPQPKGEDATKPTLNAILNLNAADLPDQDAAVAKYKQEVADYITSLGFNPANYDIQYIVNTP